MSIMHVRHSGAMSTRKGGLMLVLFGLVILSFACYRAVLQYQFLKSATVTDGVVIGSQLGVEIHDGKVQMPVIKYVDSNDSVRYLLTDSQFFPNQPFRLNQHLQVAYDGNQSDHAELYMKFSPSYLNAIVVCMIAMGLIAVGMLCFLENEDTEYS